MKILKSTNQTGHLLAFSSTHSEHDNFSIFFPVQGLKQFQSLLEISNGFERCFEKYRKRYNYVQYSISDFGRINESFPEINKNRLIVLDQTALLDEHAHFINHFGNILFERLSGGFEPIFPSIVTGANATGSNFFDRHETIETINKLIEDGQNILLRAPRRFGKSSLLKHITKYPSENRLVCYIDLEGGKSCEDFVEQILKGLLTNPACNGCLTDSLSIQKNHEMSEIERMDLIREERIKIRKNWSSYAESLIETIERKADGEKILLILDEVSFLIEDMLEHGEDQKDNVRKLLSWFQKTRTVMQNVRLILSGSEHLPTFLKGYAIEGYLDDLEEVSLDLFDIPTARNFIFLVLTGCNIVTTLKEINQILELMGKPIPYFLQLFLDAICRECSEKQSLTCDDLATIYYNNLLGPDSKRYFESILKQLDRYQRFGRNGQSAALRILNRLADTDTCPVDQLNFIWQNEVGSEELFHVMLCILQDDFYIRIQNDEACFDSKLLKDWWNRHVLPSAE